MPASAFLPIACCPVERRSVFYDARDTIDSAIKTLALFLTFSAAAATAAIAQAPANGDDTLIFQTQKDWSPRVNVEAGTVMTYGIQDNLPERIRSWKEHGYRVSVMTGVAWGTYGDYLRGDFDDKEHWNETQQESSGKLIQHGGREVPYGRHSNQ